VRERIMLGYYVAVATATRCAAHLVLQPMDVNAWVVLDRQIDYALVAVRARNPDPAAQTQTLNALLTALR
jgi:hypothetical protein